MLGFFVKSSGEQANSEFASFIWGKEGIDTWISSALKDRSYGKGVKLLLIMFYVEGHLPMWLPKRIRASYSKKEQALSVEVPVLKKHFSSGDKKERTAFILNQVLLSLEAARGVRKRNGLDFDLDSLIRDVNEAGKRWLETSSGGQSFL
jgi:hypothetical protein